MLLCKQSMQHVLSWIRNQITHGFQEWSVNHQLATVNLYPLIKYITVNKASLSEESSVDKQENSNYDKTGTIK